MRTAAAIDWLRLQQPRRRMASTRQHPPAGPNRSARCGARPARGTWRGCAAALRTCFVRGGRCRVTAGAAVAVCGGCTTPPRCRPPAARSAGSIATSTIGLPDGRQDKTSIWISTCVHDWRALGAGVHELEGREETPEGCAPLPVGAGGLLSVGRRPSLRRRGHHLNTARAG